MNMLRDLASAMRRLPLPSGAGSVSASSLVHGSGAANAASLVGNVLGHGLEGHGPRHEGPFEPAPEPTPEDPGAPGRALVGAGAPGHAARSDHDTLAAPTIYQQNGARAAVFKAGQQHARWRNTYLSHAMPAVLQLQRHLANGSINQPTVRAQLALEVRLFRDRLSKANCDWHHVTDASYLLCTYLDEVNSDAARHSSQIPYGGERSLLVEFHGDAWGGEDAFAALERWMALDRPPLDLLALYEMILSLGWQGRYRIRERGDVLLQDLRSQLHALIWHNHEPAPLGTALMLSPAARAPWWTPARAGMVCFALAAIAYAVATLDLDARGRPVREALAAWAPPVRTINIAETLPPPLPKLLTEGWLTAYKHPLGWLLVFRSDGAFDVGKAIVRADFAPNIERLGRALAPWPGDLEVIGHTDLQPIRAGALKSNQALSEDRAQNVAKQLRESASAEGPRAPADGVRRQITFSGRGDSEPVDLARTPSAFERNRRVEVLWKVVPAGRERAAAQIGAEVKDAPRRPVDSSADAGAPR